MSDERLVRRGDTVWQVHLHDRRPVLVVLEFRSGEEPRIALRILAYMSLLYQELVRNDAPELGEHGRLPAVLSAIADPERLAEVGEWLVHCEIGHGARLAPRLAADPGGAARLRVRAQSRRNAARGDEPVKHAVMLTGALRW